MLVGPLILHAFHPLKRVIDQVATWEALRAIEDQGLAHVRHYPTTGEWGYVAALQAVWEHPGDVVVVEQDIVPTWSHIYELLSCPYRFCAWDFLLANGVSWTTIEGGIGLGCAKLSKEARDGVVQRPPVPQVAWPDTVHYLYDYLPSVHVHRPLITHHHK